MTKVLDKNELLVKKANKVLRKGKCKATAYEIGYISFVSRIDMSPFYVHVEVEWKNFPKSMMKKPKRIDFESKEEFLKACRAIVKKREVYNERHVLEARRLLLAAAIKYKSFRQDGKLKLKLA